MERVGDTPGLTPIAHDVSLTRGISVRGRPVRGVVNDFLLGNSPRSDELRNFMRTQRQVTTGDDGSYSIVALDGPGLLASSAYSDRFPEGVGVDWFKQTKPFDLNPNVRSNAYIALPLNANPKAFDTLIELNLPTARLKEKPWRCPACFGHDPARPRMSGMTRSTGANAARAVSGARFGSAGC